MLKTLEIVEAKLPSLLQDGQRWDSVLVTYQKPFVHRLWRDLPAEGVRVLLHKILPCSAEEALFHPHPWPSAVRLLAGNYYMTVGAGDPSGPPPKVATTVQLSAGGQYEMVDPFGWHAVQPCDQPSWSLMVTGTPWPKSAFERPSKAQGPLGEQEAEDLLQEFRELLGIHA